MGKAISQALANRRNGCIICDGWRDDMIALADHGARICRPCVTRVGRAILSANPTVLGHLWPTTSSVGEVSRGALPPEEVNAEEVFAAFKAGVEKQISADDAQTHLDLAVAYGEMGLIADAVREAATALGERASPTIATRAVNWLFAPGRAHPEALRTISRTLRSE